MAGKDVTVLFDESGTPQVGNNDQTDWFLGVAVRYDQSAENAIFSEYKSEFGLSNTTPLKNDRIKNSRAVRIAELLAGLPLSIFVSGVNIADPKYREIIVEYERFGNNARANHRPESRERPIAQIIHSHVLDHCLFHSIMDYFEVGGGDAAFSVFIDNWSIPIEDIDTYLGYRTKLLNQSISLLCAKHHIGQPDSIDRLQLLVDDSCRKRFVDVVASVISRAFLKTDSPKYSQEPMYILEMCGKAHFGDETGYSIRIMQGTMNTPPPEANQWFEP